MLSLGFMSLRAFLASFDRRAYRPSTSLCTSPNSACAILCASLPKLLIWLSRFFIASPRPLPASVTMPLAFMRTKAISSANTVRAFLSKTMSTWSSTRPAKPLRSKSLITFSACSALSLSTLAMVFASNAFTESSNFFTDLNSSPPVCIRPKRSPADDPAAVLQAPTSASTASNIFVTRPLICSTPSLLANSNPKRAKIPLIILVCRANNSLDEEMLSKHFLRSV